MPGTEAEEIDGEEVQGNMEAQEAEGDTETSLQHLGTVNARLRGPSCSRCECELGLRCLTGTVTQVPR